MAKKFLPQSSMRNGTFILAVSEFVLRKRDATDCADSGIPSDCQIYIGLRRCAQFCSEFAWSDERTPFGPGSYENWADGAPSMPSGQLACVEMLENGEWNDLPCDNQRLFVCERPANAAPAAPQPN